MRIGVSALAMRGHAAALDSGVARYCAGLIDAWVADGGGHEFVVWISADFEVPEQWRGTAHLSFEVAHGPWARYKTLWELRSAGDAARSCGCGVWFSTAHGVPSRSPVPTVLSVQDLFTFSHPEFYTRKHRWVIGWAMRRALRQADGFVAISEHTKGELERLFEVAVDRVTVTPLGFDRQVLPLSSRDISKGELEALGVRGEDYLLTLSTVEPRKNLSRLFEAFAGLIAGGDRGDLRLVIAGSRGWKTASIYRRPEEVGIADRVDFLGYVPDPDLVRLFARCRAFVLPSIIEGFGLPLLEAMASGVPVVCSRAGSLPEVGGDVPIYFDPESIDDMTEAIGRRLDSTEPREQLSVKGRRQAARFTWRDTADRTLAALLAAGGEA